MPPSQFLVIALILVLLAWLLRVVVRSGVDRSRAREAARLRSVVRRAAATSRQRAGSPADALRREAAERARSRSGRG